MHLSASPILYVMTRNRAASLPFWRDVLGAEVLAETPFAVQLHLHGLRIDLTSAADHVATSHPVLGLPVADILSESRHLAANGVRFLAYPGLTDGEFQICSFGAKRLNWFADPDGNVLGLVEG